MNRLPQAKNENIVVQDLRDELLVYNLKTHQAFTLNEPLKIVYNACDDETSFDELKRKYKFSDDLIHLALDELSANDLLEDYGSDHFKGLSRREAIKKVGLASMITLPVISALIAPQAAYALSCGVNVNCAGVCVDTQTSSNNCGACGRACATGYKCSNGTCVFDPTATNCAAGYTKCAGICRDLTNDSNNCGACGRACPSGKTCSNGTCL